MTNRREQTPAGTLLPPEPWHVAVCCVLGTAVGGSALSSFGLGNFIKDIVAGLHWTRGGASGALSLYLIGLGASGMIAGLLVDRFGPRPVAIASVTLLAAGLGLAATSTTPMMIRTFFLMMGLAGGATTSLPYQVAIVACFHRSRGLALGIAATGTGLGGVVLPQIIAAVVQPYGWRTGLVALALLLVVVALPAAVIGLSRSRSPGAAPSPVRPALSLMPVLRARDYWPIAGSIALSAVIVSGVSIQAPAVISDLGLSRERTAIIVSLLAVCGIAGRIVSGWLIDRLFAPRVAAATFLVAALGVLLVTIGPAGWVVMVGFGITGFTLGAEANVAGYLLSRYLPRDQFGRALGLTIAVFSAASAVGVAIMGYSFDGFGSYHPALILLLAMSPLPIVLVLRLGAYRADEG